jgi:Leucine-rich repeat (LRR) protein
MLNKSSNSLSSIKIKELETKNNWQIIDLSHNAIEFIDRPDLLQKQNDLESLQLDFNFNFSARENEHIFVSRRLKRMSCKGCGFVEVQSQHFAGFGSLLKLGNIVMYSLSPCNYS